MSAVFIVSRVWDFEGKEVEAVCATEEAARGEASAVKADRQNSANWVEVDEWEVGNESGFSRHKRQVLEEKLS